MKRPIFALLVATLGSLNQVNGHTVEVRHCLTTEGNLRIFLEHWHNDFIETIGEAGTIEVEIEEPNGGKTVEEYTPVGIINNVDVYNGGVLPGCVGNGVPELVSICSDKNAEHDWAYFDFSFSCENLSSYTILKGNTDILRAGCEDVFPVSVIPALDYCPDSPSVSPSVSLAPTLYTEPNNCFDINNPNALPKEGCILQSTRSSCETAKCVWFNSDEYCGTCDELTKKNACNSQRYCGWFKEQPSGVPSVEPSITPTGVPSVEQPSSTPSETPPDGICAPFDPDTAESTAACRLYVIKQACKKDSNQCVWFNQDQYCGTCDELPSKNWCIKRGCEWTSFL